MLTTHVSSSIAAPETEKSAAVSLSLSLPVTQVSGAVSLAVEDSFLLDPTVRISLGGVKAYVEVNVAASAAVQESLELFASPALDIDLLNILDVELDAAFALDLVLGVAAAIDVSAGIYIEFPEDAYVDVSLISKDVVNVALDGLKTKALPIGVGAEVDLAVAVTLELGLRLRSQIGVSAKVDIVGLDLLNGEAQVSIWLSLFDYTAVLVSTSDCVLSVTEALAISIGLAVELDVEALDILDLSLAPSAFITLANTRLAIACLDSRGQPGGSVSSDGSGSGSPSHAASSGFHPNATASAMTTPTGAGLVTSTRSATTTYTITSCAASVPNCPADYTQKVITSTVIRETTICPATMTGGAWPTTTSKPAVAVTTITDTMTTVVPCQTRTTSHFTPPASSEKPVPTITIVDTTTVCPVTMTASSTGPKGTLPASNTAEYTTPISQHTTAASQYTAPASQYTASASQYTAPASQYSAPASQYTAPASQYTAPASQYPTSGVAMSGSSSMVIVPSSNLTSMVTVPCPTASGSLPTSSTPSAPITAGAGSLKTGLFAIALPIALAAML